MSCPHTNELYLRLLEKAAGPGGEAWLMRCLQECPSSVNPVEEETRTPLPVPVTFLLPSGSSNATEDAMESREVVASAPNVPDVIFDGPAPEVVIGARPEARGSPEQLRRSLRSSSRTKRKNYSPEIAGSSRAASKKTTVPPSRPAGSGSPPRREDAGPSAAVRASGGFSNYARRQPRKAYRVHPIYGTSCGTDTGIREEVHC
ncbi:uncharacterized protein LOC130285274 [Hyla sarda]|uniref:uncharacterized protein LOC130285274 n=1 Tax=Hyla sarda TaxID=327740 RepID=UPI0024C2A2ED|nr:uncharacterized protein LOC130285274 [Hyla sarda]